MTDKLKIIITGFDVFGSLAYNPSKIIIHFIDEYIINKKKESDSSEKGTNECVDFFINNRYYLKGSIEKYTFDNAIPKEIEFDKKESQQAIEKRSDNHSGRGTHVNNDNIANMHNINIGEKEEEKEKDKEYETNPFHMVDELRNFNAEQIKNQLVELSLLFNENCFQFIKTQICLVNKESVDKLVQEIYNGWEVEQEREKKKGKKKMETDNFLNGPGPVIVIHMGVHAKGRYVTLETTGRDLNPEENLKNISNEDLSTKEHIETTLNLQNIVQQINVDINLKVDLSHDCGTYICNYVYYQSMKAARIYSIPVLFIHLPLFETIQFHEQVVIIRHILLCLYKELSMYDS